MVINLYCYYKSKNPILITQISSNVVPKRGEFIYFNNHVDKDLIIKQFNTVKFRVYSNIYMPQNNEEILSSVLVYLVKA